MGNLTVNLLFAAVFGGMAWNSFPRGWRFFKVGWSAFRANAEHAELETNIERQRDLNTGNTFLLAGVAWLLGGLVSVLMSVLFIYFAIFDIGIFNFLY